MCGLTGFWDVSGRGSRDELESTAARMAGMLLHRGPDDGGTWADEAAGIALGHRRLSIVDLSSCGHQPMESAGGRYVVAFNGEIYNFQPLRRELEQRGHRFRGHSDTEVLLAAVEAWGLEAALRRFVGMFAFALWDRERRSLFLARDRMGEKPLYYGWSGGVFLFGSELKALRGHPAWRGEIDRDSLALYLRYNYVPAPYSIYRGIAKLMPGTYAEVRPDAPGAHPQPVAYWSMGDVVEAGARDPFRGSDAEAEAALDELLRDAVRQQLMGDVPLGAFLSGGVDSSTVVALMQAQSARPVRTFTIGFHEDQFNEAEHAKAVAAHLGTDHTELYVTPREAMEVIPSLPSLYDEPFADSSQVPTFLVSQLARRSVTVSLSGDGGDELFGGYNRYFLGRRVWDRIRPVPRPLRRAAAGLVTRVAPAHWDRVNRMLPARLRQPQLADRLRKAAEVVGAPDPEAIYMRLVSQWMDPTALVPGSVEPLTTVTDRGAWPRLDDFTERMMYLDAVSYLPGDILAKVDRAAMGVSLETRVPLLDHRVVELAWRLPLGMKVRGGKGKWILRQVLHRYVPRELIERPKMGFGIPVGDWLRGPLRDWAEALLDERRLRGEGYFDPAPIRQRWREHLSGERDWQWALWSVLMFQAWSEGAGSPEATEVGRAAAGV
ncbi:MAG: asparagine synthase (glutamine-hydrolyzing) [Longimicrobiaceae bacterium]